MIGARRILPGLLFAAAFALPATAQDANVTALSGTLKKIKDTGTITLGYRESSLPFSYLNKRQQPIGYSIDLCREIVEEVATELDGMDIKIALAPVTAADRLDKVKAGAVDLECGSTTSNLQRQKEVAFSPVFFVAGTKLMVPNASAVKSYRDLAGKTVVVTAGTTNEATLRTLSDKQKLGVTIVTARDHAQSLAMLVAGKADAFATDDALLYGFIATERPRYESRRRLSVLRSLWPRLSPRRSKLCRDRRARLYADGERAAARRALQQMVLAPAADGGNAQSADEPAARGDFQSPRRAGVDHSTGLSVLSAMRFGHQR
jgi:ABC-type amino acid transport substrate-binding protein